MNQLRIAFSWPKKHREHRFNSGVSLHSHTLHSLESLCFIDQVTGNVPFLSSLIRREKAKVRAVRGCDLDLKNAWWTPPLSARQAWELERSQIVHSLGLHALVSLSDHDNIEAGLNLQVLEETRACPISIEWSVPFGPTFFHVGVHNLPVDSAVTMTRAMNQFTAAPHEGGIAPLLEYLAEAAGSLLVLNHPAWDENHIGDAQHAACLDGFMTRFGRFLHALELNGLRPWSENLKAIHVAERFGLPVVSGGDRHGREPNACVNLTAARTFAEFAAELREGAGSDILFFPQYQQSLKMRVFENVVDILKQDPNHALGWHHWTKRVLYRSDTGNVKSLDELCGGQFPSIVNRLELVRRLVESGAVKSALRYALHEKEEFALQPARPLYALSFQQVDHD